MKTFAKAQLSSFLGGLVDYGTMVFFTEFFGVPYTISIAMGGIVGAVVNFSINRYWTFGAADGQKRVQLPKFILMVAGSILLKSSGTYLLTQYSGFDYKITRLIIDLVVSWVFNYNLQKYWIFRQNGKR